LIGLPFVSDVGVHVVDLVDHFSASYLLILGGLGECLAVGWTRVNQKKLENGLRAGDAPGPASEPSSSGTDSSGAGNSDDDDGGGDDDVIAVDEVPRLPESTGASRRCCDLAAYERALTSQGYEEHDMMAIEFLRRSLNEVSALTLPRLWNWMLRVVIPVALLFMLGATFYADLSRPYNDLKPAYIAAGWVLLACLLVAVFLSYFYFRRRISLDEGASPGERDALLGAR
jgi:hypothetical protein